MRAEHPLPLLFLIFTLRFCDSLAQALVASSATVTVCAPISVRSHIIIIIFIFFIVDSSITLVVNSDKYI